MRLKLNNRLILEITAIGLVMMVSNVSSLNAPSLIPTVAPKIEVVENLPIDNKIITIEKKDNISAEEYIRNYFSDIPVMVEIARCESQFRHYDKNGNVLRGEQNNQDKGVMQINTRYHEGDSAKLGYDISTLKGNAAYARYLFEKSGVAPWKSSSKCWGKTLAYSEYQKLSLNK